VSCFVNVMYGLSLEFLSACRFGLASYACTRDLGRAWRLSEQIQAGMVAINEGSISTSFAPFGGWKHSGLGVEGGSYGLQEYLVTKCTFMGYNYADPAER
jgi:succinate-semialdehyde dehydrogenase/glutarate-semialdehyde dehydrogenase